MLLPSLREYQAIASLETRKKLAKVISVILNGPTRSGKTITATDLVIKAIQKGLTVVFLCDRRELIEQTAKAFISHHIDFQIINRATKEILHTKCYIGMVETFYRRASVGWFKDIEINLFIFDEAHIGNYFKVINLFPSIMRIGLTATPVSSTANHPLNKFYKEIVVASNTPKLIKQGYLVPAIEMGHNRLLKFKVLAGEFSNESQAEQWKSNKIDDKMINMWMKYAHERKTIVYCRDITHAEEVVKLFTDRDISARTVHSKMDEEERWSVLAAYRNNFCQVLVNVGVLTKGYDSPHTSCIVEDRATSSTSLHHQMVGRGGTMFKNKKDFIIIDMGNNILRHGSFNEEIDWEQLFKDETRDKKFTVKTNIRLCPVCYTYQVNKFISSCATCGNNFKFNKMIDPADTIPETLQKPTSEMTYTELRTYAKLKGYKPQWAWMKRFGNVREKRFK